MRKRILSLLLALTLALSAGVFGVIPALAADSCVSVKADAVTTGEVVAGSLLEIKLTDVFEDMRPFWTGPNTPSPPQQPKTAMR